MHLSAKRRLTLARRRTDFEQVAGDNREHHVELEVAGRPAEGYGGVVADDLGDYLGHGLWYDGVHFPRHYRATGLQVRDAQLGQTGPRTAAHPADVGCTFVQRHGHRAHGSRRFHQGIARTLGFEMVPRLG